VTERWRVQLLAVMTPGSLLLTYRRLASEGIVALGVTLSRCVVVRRAAYITYRLHAALVSVSLSSSSIVY